MSEPNVQKQTFEVEIRGIPDPIAVMNEYKIISGIVCQTCGKKNTFRMTRQEIIARKTKEEFPFLIQGDIVMCTCKHCEQLADFTFKFKLKEK
ncbi:MAG TPA: hypothetical protein VJA22_02570 [Patescibacteria group bacterium]|nr:hypothetical protein [Patescibacteria group bacterium]